MPEPYRDNPESDVENDESRYEAGRRRAQRMFDGFLDFALQGNILEIAFGLIVAAAFTSIVNSFVDDILLPPLSVIFPLNRNLDEKFAVLQAGPNYGKQGGYNTLAQAKADGAVILSYGIFVGHVINFLSIGVSLYALAGIAQYFSHDPIIKHTVKCRYCKKRVSERAKRCVNCTSWLDGREDR